MTRAIVVANVAAPGVSAATVVRTATTLRRAGWEILTVTTGDPDEIRADAAQARREELDAVVVLGGDGTVMLVATTLVGSKTLLGIIPGGTGNLLAGTLGISRNPQVAANQLVHAQPRQIDLGRVEWDGLPYHFGVACGAGFDARIMAGASRAEKRRWGRAAYAASFVRELRKVENAKITLTVDGERHELEAAVAMVTNCGELLPGLLRPAYPVSPDDGILDIFCLRADGVFETIRGIRTLLHRTKPGADRHGRTHVYSGREILIASDPPMPVELDGSVLGSTPVLIRTIPKALTILAPPPPASAAERLSIGLPTVRRR